MYESEPLYSQLMLSAAVGITLLAALLLNIRIPHDKRLTKLRTARKYLTISYFVLAGLNLVSYCTGYDAELDRANTLAVAPYQALLMTMTLLVFIRPDRVQVKSFYLQFAAITLVALLLNVTLLCLPRLFPILFYATVAGYVLQLIIYTRIFYRAYHHTLRQVEDYYDDEEESRLRWVKSGFNGMLIIGAMAFIALFADSWFYLIFIPMYIACYAFVAFKFSKYLHEMAFLLPVLDKAEETAALPLSGKEHHLKAALEEWIAQKGYLAKDVPTEEIARMLGTNIATLRAYSKKCYGMDFCSWRVEARIREAQRIFDEHPDFTPVQVGNMVGIPDRGYFLRQFRKATGQTPTEYRMERMKIGRTFVEAGISE